MPMHNPTQGHRRATVAGLLLATSLILTACGQSAPQSDIQTSAQQNYAVRPVGQTTPAVIGRNDKTPQSLIAKPWMGDAAGPPQNLNLSPDGARLLYTISNADGSNPRAYLLDTRAATLDHTKYNGAWDRESRRVVT